MSLKLTPWFDGKTHKPVRRGVYGLMCGGLHDLYGYQYWDGKTWRGWRLSIADAFKARYLAAVDDKYQNDDWRGVAKEPA